MRSHKSSAAKLYYNGCLKGSLMHVAPACTRSAEGSDHFRSYVHSLSLYFYKRLFPGIVLQWLFIVGNNVVTLSCLACGY
jgi:hypothetical protein